MTLRFLVVDDEPIIREYIGLILETSYRGCEVRLAGTNAEAQDVLSEFTPNLITTDIIHPGGSGYELLTHLRQDPKTEFTPVIAMSATGQRNELQQYRHGFEAVLPKPFTVPEFLDRVDRLLHLRTDPDAVLIHLGRESQDHDYKECLQLGSKMEVAAFAKDVIAMANFGGGRIIVGVKETRPGEFSAEGVSDAVADTLEVSRVNRAVRTYLDPPVAIRSRRVRDGTRLFVFLEVASAPGIPVLAAKQHEKAGLYPGRIYTRTTACESAEVRTSAELRQLLERLRAYSGT